LREPNRKPTKASGDLRGRPGGGCVGGSPPRARGDWGPHPRRSDGIERRRRLTGAGHMLSGTVFPATSHRCIGAKSFHATCVYLLSHNAGAPHPGLSGGSGTSERNTKTAGVSWAFPWSRGHHQGPGTPFGATPAVAWHPVAFYSTALPSFYVQQCLMPFSGPFFDRPRLETFLPSS